jgi:branched-subunit amino acid aminotransferase/4-amino-4-deoxychorismate lyase
MFKNGKLITPKDNILLGTRRWLTLKVAKGNFEIEERKVKLSEFLNADEAFMTSANRDILPVTQINDQKIGNGKVGINTKLLMKLYREYIYKNR